MGNSILKTGIKTGIAAALAIILFQLSNIFLVYKYSGIDYYVAAVAVLFLIAGFFISKYYHPVKENQTVIEDPLSGLTSKELLILKQITDGKSNKEIAALNYVEVSTIKTHINNIYNKLGLRKRRDAIAKYRGKLES